MLLFDYFKPTEYFVDHLHFNHRGTTYVGHGILIWNPQEGFHLRARINPKESSSAPVKIMLRPIEIQKTVLVRLRLYGGGLRAVLPLYAVNELQLADGILSQRFSRALFIQPASVQRQDSWRGSALFECAESVVLPDVVVVETKVQGTLMGKKYSLEGLHFKGQDGMSVIARLQKEQQLIEASWTLPSTRWKKRFFWEYADGFRYALSVLSGQMIQMKYREVHRKGRIYQEIIRNPNPFKLGKIFVMFDDLRLDREKVLHLADFFTQSDDRSDVARHIFIQVAEASRQHTVAGQALLLSTVLEAILRTIYNQPFKPKKKESTLNIEAFLKRFRTQYLESSPRGKQWRPIIRKVLPAYRRLRHRYAHPDWLTSFGGSYSEEETERIINDMIVLSRFYRLVILRLAGIEIDEPRLPEPFGNGDH